MKKQVLAWGLVCCLLLSSCASMLDRSYSSVTLHVDRPTAVEDSSDLRVENYRDLVSAVLYLVKLGAETGTLYLYDYPGEVDSDLARACTEVATQDPVAAYAVDYIRHTSTRVVSYDQAKLEIHYRRTMEQVRSMVNVIGAGALRTELQRALTDLAPEVVLRVSYFSQDEEFIAELIQQIYEEDPITWVGCPKIQINLYPKTGWERVVEVLLTWSESTGVIQDQRDRLSQRAEQMDATLELTEVLYRRGTGNKESKMLIRLQTGEGKRLYYDPQGEDQIYTWTEMENLGYCLPETPE